MLALVCTLAWGSSAWALDQKDGAYQIGTADDLTAFAAIVNGGENNANAVLTADIDMTGKTWTPIGNNDNRYVGTFDGQYHVIDNLVCTGTDKIGIFGVVNGGCVVKNLVAGAGNKITGTAMVGGIIGCSDGSGWVTLENVGHEGYVEGSGNNCCAIFGVVMNGGPATRITNCYNTGDIKAGGESAIITGWFGGHSSGEVKGFWNTGKILSGGDGDNSLWRNSTGITTERLFHTAAHQGATVIGDGDVASGRLAFQLNGNADAGTWRQNLSDPKDAHPTCDPSHAKVYANGTLDCAGNAKEGSAMTYSNTEGATRDDHHFDDGFCTVCATPDPDYLEAEDGAYTLATPHQLAWFAAIVNSGNTTASARLYGDIDFSDAAGFQGIGTFSNPFCGNFDGQGAIVSNLTIIMPGEENVGFFRVIGAGANISNFTIDESCTFSGKAFTGAFAGRAVGNGEATLQRLGNEGSVNTTDQNAGAIVGCNTSSELHLSLTNCYNAGSISSGWEAGGLSGWLGNDANTTNCYNMGTVTNGESFARGNNIQVVNCFDPVTDWPALPKSPIEDFTNGVIYDKLAAAAGDGIWFLSAKENGHPVLYDSGITTGIDDLQIFDLRFDGAVYDLSGRKMVNGKLPKGIYVKDGRKVILR